MLLHRKFLIALVVIALTTPSLPGEPTRLDPDTGITITEGFDAEVVYDVPKSQGSWVAMTFDPKGRLIVSDQDDKGVFRVTLPDGDDPDARPQVESLPGFPYEPIPWGRRTVGGALGFLYAFDSLYMSTMKGLYRIRDTDDDDTYDEFALLMKLGVGYEHSAHNLIVSEDKKALYLVTGNHTRLPEGIPSRLPPVWAQDALLPAMPDAMGHAVSIRPPAGWICRFAPDGSQWTMIASGLRNAVDIAINREGELFTYDSDLEFDIGSPWYRPTRVNHVISGSEFGWRSGSAKWPEYFADSFGAVVNIGPGSPTGIQFGHHSNFPPRYQDKLFICDWTFGTIYTVDMEESGSSYTGTFTEFLNGAPLNISAMRFGPDGNMYFLVGGRNTDSKLYRVRYTGPESSAPVKTLVANQDLRDVRHSLERFHESGSHRAEAIDTAWPYLAHEDRAIRYAARLAIENQPFAHWQERVFLETNPRAQIYAAIALSRHAPASLADRAHALLRGIDPKPLRRNDQLALLRASSLCFQRLGPPTDEQIQAAIAQFDPLYPASDHNLNTELCRMLCYLDAPSVVTKTIALMQSTQTQALTYDAAMLKRHEYGKAILETMANTPNSQNIHYAYCLRRVQRGWTLDARKYYFQWLNETLSKSGGKSFAGYIRAIREDAIAHLPEEEAATVSYLLGAIASVDLAALPNPKGPGNAWTLSDAAPLFDQPLAGRDYEQGERMFAAGRCVACHRMRGTGGYSGPDLGSVGQRYSVEDILQAIIEPSHSISEQYRASEIERSDGGVLFGRVIIDTEEEVALATNPFDFSQLTTIPRNEIAAVRPSNLSLMPPGTIFGMNSEELRDLIAYLVAGANPQHDAFR